MEQEKILKAIENILLNNYKKNINEYIADRIYEKREEISNINFSKNTTLKFYKLINTIEANIKNGTTESDDFSLLIERFLKMDDALNKDEIINEILKDE